MGWIALLTVYVLGAPVIAASVWAATRNKRSTVVTALLWMPIAVWCVGVDVVDKVVRTAK